MAWSDAARAAAKEARRRHARTKFSSAQDAHFKARVQLIKAKSFNGPKQWGNRPGWMARRMTAEAKVVEAAFHVKQTGKALTRIGKSIFK